MAPFITSARLTTRTPFYNATTPAPEGAATRQRRPTPPRTGWRRSQPLGPAALAVELT